MAHNTLKPLIGVIGGSGLYKLPGLQTVATLEPLTPWGKPSSPITIASLPTSPSHLIAFISRHGQHHSISPSDIPFCANVASLKHLGVIAIVAFSSVGSLREEMKPGDVVVPDQIIDRTKSGFRPTSFFTSGTQQQQQQDKGSGVEGVVVHVSFGDPFDVKLSKAVTQCIRDELQNGRGGEGEVENVQVHEKATVVCMEGPQFSTRAESEMYRAWGGDIINMSVIPEAKLARECELAYCLIAQVTDYDSWRIEKDAVTVTDVMSTISRNISLSNRLSLTMLSNIYQQLESGQLTPSTQIGSTVKSIVTHSTPQHSICQASLQKLAYILPKDFPQNEGVTSINQ